MESTTLASHIKEFLQTSLNTKEYEAFPLAGDASNRKYYRVVKNGEPMVLMDWEPFVDDASYPFLSVLNHFAKHGINVPQVIDKSPSKGLVLLEDLGDLTLERKFWESTDQQRVLPFYKLAIDELIKIHYPASSDRSSQCTAFGVSFDRKKLLWELNYGRTHFLEQMCALRLSAGEEKELDKCFDDICARLDREDKYICHRDYHSRNLMIKLGKMRVIDFQDARMGPIQYDLVSLVHDSYVNIHEETSATILDYYLQQAAEHQPRPISRDHFDDIFRLQFVQRGFKVCGSFASFFNTREDRRYLKYIKPTIEKVVAYLEYFPEYSSFRNLLVDNRLVDKRYQDL